MTHYVFRTLLHEIRQLKAEHAETIQNANQLGCDQNLLTELRVLRQRKDELEMRMSALQETRRELMVQLEGLMKLLKVIQIEDFYERFLLKICRLIDNLLLFRSGIFLWSQFCNHRMTIILC